MTVFVGNGEYGLGCSDYTVRSKLLEFPHLFGRLLAIYKNLLRGRPEGELLLIDPTAGAGVYAWHGRHLEGMVVQAIRALLATDLRWTYCAVESNPKHVRSLRAALDALTPADGWEPHQRIIVRPGDSRAQVPDFLDTLAPGPYRCGLFIPDANGITDFDAQAAWLRHPRARYFDLLGHCQAVALKRWISVRTGPIQPPDRRRLHERLLALPRERILIRRLEGNPQWLFYLATNAKDVGSWRGARFVDVRTPEGIAELERASFTEAQLAAGEGLPGAARNVQLSLFDVPPQPRP